MVVLVEEQRVEWRILAGDRYVLLAPDTDGLLKSRIFPGLWLDRKALLGEDLAALAAAVELGLQSRS